MHNPGVTGAGLAEGGTSQPQGASCFRGETPVISNSASHCLPQDGLWHGQGYRGTEKGFSALWRNGESQGLIESGPRSYRFYNLRFYRLRFYYLGFYRDENATKNIEQVGMGNRHDSKWTLRDCKTTSVARPYEASRITVPLGR